MSVHIRCQYRLIYARLIYARVAELVDALDLGSSGATRGSSSLPFRTSLNRDEGRAQASLVGGFCTFRRCQTAENRGKIGGKID